MARRRKKSDKKFSITSILFYLFIALILGLVYTGDLKPIIDILDDESLEVSVGDIKFTPYYVLKSIFAVVVTFWVAGVVVNFVRGNLIKLRIRSSSKSLLSKTATIVIYATAFLMTLNIMGIDLTALAVFSGALGIGLGFGLQKITSNFISGIIMLFERSVEQGDVVELESGVYGYIRSVNARYTLVETYDGKEIMIPNEEFIVDRVTNWTYSNTRGRLAVTIGVSYSADIHLCKKIILDSAKNHELCSKDEKPKCHLVEFADSSVNFLLFVWIDDFSEGRYTIQNDILFTIWDEFKKHDIEIPFPQRDLHIKNIDELIKKGGEPKQNGTKPEERTKRRVSAKVTSTPKKDKKKLH